MNAEQVVEKILSEAKSEAEKIISEARDNAEQVRKQARAELEQYREETRRLAEQAGEDKRTRMLANTRMENRKLLLGAKVEMLDEVFRQAGERIKNLPDEEYKELMGGLLQKAVQTGDEEVLIGRNETRIDQSFIKKVNRELLNGYKGNIRLSDEKADIEGGFILKRGKIRINAGIAVLVNTARSALEMEITKLLFSDNES